MLNRLIAGATARKTRFHDELGNRVPLSRAVRNGPRAIATGIARLAFRYRPVRPWISYDAQQILAKHLTSRSRVLEFGSGMSTVWYAEHAGQVVSIEDYRPWYDQVLGIIADRDVTNIVYRFAADPDEYTSLTEAERGDGFDLIMVDGKARDLCVRRALNLLRPGGIFYLDNSDKGTEGNSGDVPEARRLLVDFAAAHDTGVQLFTDFAPTQLFAQQGLMIRLS